MGRIAYALRVKMFCWRKTQILPQFKKQRDSAPAGASGRRRRICSNFFFLCVLSGSAWDQSSFSSSRPASPQGTKPA